jgi:hypothetical protein
VGLLAVEGPGFLVKDFDAYWQDPAHRARVLDLVCRVEREPALLGLTACTCWRWHERTPNLVKVGVELPSQTCMW